MSTQNLTFTAGEKKTAGPGNFLRIDSATGVLTLKFKHRKTGINEEHTAEQGDHFTFKPAPGQDFAFDAVEITSASAQTITYTTSDGVKGSDKVAGSVEVKPSSALATTPDVTATKNSKTQIIAANPGRMRVQIANMHDTITLRYGDTNTAAGQGLPLYPGVAVDISTTDAVYVWNPDLAIDVLVAVNEES